MTNRTDNIADQSKNKEFVVDFPNSVTSTHDTDNDFGPPLSQLMIDLGIKGTVEDNQAAGSAKSAIFGTPDSVSILEAGATAGAKGWSALLAAVGGSTAAATAIAGFWHNTNDVHNSLVIGGCVVMAACALAIGIIFYGDLVARGQGAAAQYHARARIADSFISAAQLAAPASAVTAASAAASDAAVTTMITALVLERTGHDGVSVTLKEGGNGSGRYLSLHPDGKLYFELDGKTWFPIADIVSFGVQE